MGTVAALAVVMSAVSLNPLDNAVTDRVDLIELNHFYDEQGKLVFDQVIFYDWCQDQCRYNVRAWRLLKKPGQVPQRDWERGDYVAIWHDGEMLREVRGQAMRETWTQYDPELAERDYLAKEKRRDLLKPIVSGVDRRATAQLRPRQDRSSTEPAVRTATNPDGSSPR